MRPSSQQVSAAALLLLALWEALGLQTASLLPPLLLSPPTAQTRAVGTASEVKMLIMLAKRTMRSYGIDGCRVANDSMPYLKRVQRRHAETDEMKMSLEEIKSRLV